jgi:hypothetical protein
MTETAREAGEQEQIDPQALAAILMREFRIADAYHDQLLILQRQSERYYEGQSFGNEVEGRSQIVLPDVQEAVDYMGQSVLRTFSSGDRTVEFEATDESDEQAADDATSAINFVFMKQQDGFRILHDCLHDGLKKKVGIIKTVMETVEKVSRERVKGHMTQIGMLPDDAEVDDVEHHGDGKVSGTVTQRKTEKRFIDYAVPTTEFRFSPQARHEDEADYLCHVCVKTRSDLVEMGFDREQAYSLPGNAPFYNVQNPVSPTLDQFIQDESSPALERVLLCEEYCRIDLDGDGIAERVKVYRVDTEILIDAETGEPSIETVDEQPFAVFCPFPRPHRLVGYSLADKVMDIQLGRSFVARQLLDGMAFANMPRPIVDTNNITEDTYADILNPIPGSPIRVRGGAASVQALQTSFDVGKSLSVMEWMTGERESRTGITRLNQGLDADALNKTATGTALMQAQGQQGEEMIARQLADTIGRLFAKKYRLMRIEGVPFKIKVDGQYRTVDPTQWPEDMNLNIRVGLGTNSKDRRIQYRMALAPFLAEGLMQGYVGPDHAFHAIDGMVRDMGLGKGADYWIDPETPEGQQAMQAKGQQPDPKTAAVQAKAQADQQKLQAGAANDQAKLQLDGQKAQQQGAIAMQTAQMKIDAQREAAAMNLMVDRERMATEAQLEARRQEIEADAKVRVAQARPGGRLDA